MSAAQILAVMGTDAAKWTDAWQQINPDARVTSGDVWGSMVSWFANALEAGRAQGRRERCGREHDWFELSPDDSLCRECGHHLVTVHIVPEVDPRRGPE